MSSVAGKVCVVTGASSGIGEATARALAEAGAIVVLAARREDRLREIAAGLGGTTYRRCDVTSPDDLRDLRDHVRQGQGRCDVLVNNAGVPGGGPFERLTMDQIERVTDTDYLSVLRATKLFLPMLLEARGHVVNVASLAGRYALPGASVYSAAKHAVVAFSEALHHELRPRGLAVTVVNPGLVATEGFVPPDSPLWRDPVARRFIMSPDRVARVIVDVIRRRRAPEVSVPRWLAAPQAGRMLAPRLYRAALGRLGARRAGSARAPDDA